MTPPPCSTIRDPRQQLICLTRELAARQSPPPRTAPGPYTQERARQSTPSDLEILRQLEGGNQLSATPPPRRPRPARVRRLRRDSTPDRSREHAREMAQAGDRLARLRARRPRDRGVPPPLRATREEQPGSRAATVPPGGASRTGRRR